jgi:hypothetical protein
MITAILTWLGSSVAQLLGSTLIGSILDGYKATLAAENSKDAITADLAKRELAVQQREAELQSQLRIAQIGRWYEPEHLAGYVLVLYMAKVYLFDAALHLGSSDAVSGTVGDWGALIIGFYFSKRGFENIVRILRR